MQRSSTELVTAHDDDDDDGDDDDDDNFHVTLPHHRCIAISVQSSNARIPIIIISIITPTKLSRVTRVTHRSKCIFSGYRRVRLALAAAELLVFCLVPCSRQAAWLVATHLCKRTLNLLYRTKPRWDLCSHRLAHDVTLVNDPF